MNCRDLCELTRLNLDRSVLTGRRHSVLAARVQNVNTEHLSGADPRLRSSRGESTLSLPQAFPSVAATAPESAPVCNRLRRCLRVPFSETGRSIRE